MPVLQSLPRELLHRIFLLSKNCNLPLVSRRFCSLLSEASLPKRMAITVLQSEDHAAQKDLLNRRFFDLALYDDAAYLIYSKITRGALLPQGSPGLRKLGLLTLDESLAPPWRLMSDLEVKPEHDLLRGRGDINYSKRIWKIHLLSELYQTGLHYGVGVANDQVNYHLDEQLEDLVAGCYTEGVIDYLSLFYAPFTRIIPYSALYIAIIENDCADYHIVYALGQYIWHLNQGSVDEELLSWAKSRKQLDEEARKRAKEEGEVTIAGQPPKNYRIGSWTKHMLKMIYAHGPSVAPYDVFFAQKEGLTVEE